MDLDCLFSLSSPNLRKLNLDNQAPFLAAWFLRGFPKVKIDVKNLINKELGDGLVRLSLRPIQSQIVSFPLKPLSYSGFFVLLCFSKLHVVSAKVSVAVQDSRKMFQ